jgi:hypothetical protein
MRNGRDRRSGEPVLGHARKERVLLIGTRSADHIRASSHTGCIAMRDRPSSENRPDTWLHPIVSLNRQILLAPRAPSIHDPYVWSGRASQEELRVGDCGLASMYPASEWSSSLLRAIMDISARSSLLPARPRRPNGSPGFDRTGKTGLHLSVHSRRPRRGSWVLEWRTALRLFVSLAPAKPTPIHVLQSSLWFDPAGGSLSPRPRLVSAVARRRRHDRLAPRHRHSHCGLQAAS